MLETLDHTIRLGSTQTFLYFDLYLYSAYAARYVYYILYTYIHIYIYTTIYILGKFYKFMNSNLKLNVDVLWFNFNRWFIFRYPGYQR